MKTNASVSGEKLTILHQGRSITFDVALEVLYFYRSGHLILLVALDGTEYSSKQNLSALVKQYAPANFIRLNRSVVFNFNFVESYKAGPKRDTLELIFKHSIRRIISGTVRNQFTVTREHISVVRDRLHLDKRDIF